MTRKGAGDQRTVRAAQDVFQRTRRRPELYRCTARICDEVVGKTDQQDGRMSGRQIRKIEKAIASKTKEHEGHTPQIRLRECVRTIFGPPLRAARLAGVIQRG